MDWHQGNAENDRDEKGWILGYFATGERSANYSKDVEIKWSDHAPGDGQGEWQESAGTSISVLVAGAMDIHFADGTASLRSRGDYALWQPGVKHRWSASQDTTIITIRWPSGPPKA